MSFLDNVLKTLFPWEFIISNYSLITIRLYFFYSLPLNNYVTIHRHLSPKINHHFVCFSYVQLQIILIAPVNKSVYLLPVTGVVIICYLSSKSSVIGKLGYWARFVDIFTICRIQREKGREKAQSPEVLLCSYRWSWMLQQDQVLQTEVDWSNNQVPTKWLEH